MAFEPGRNRLCIIDMALNAKGERLKTLRQEPGVKWGNCCTNIAEQREAYLEDIGQVRAKWRSDSKCLGIYKSVIARIWLIEILKAIWIFRIIESARINNRTHHCISMSREELCCRVHYNVCAMFDRTNQEWSCDSVINYEWDSIFVCDFCYRFDIKYIVLRVCNRLAEESLGIWTYRFLPTLGIFGVIDERYFDTEFWKCVMEQVIRSTVERWRRDDVIASFCNIEYRECCSSRS